MITSLRLSLLIINIVAIWPITKEAYPKTLSFNKSPPFILFSFLNFYVKKNSLLLSLY
nr:MAG TPA: hypothetical protein [Caudoviricetes sp.]